MNNNIYLNNFKIIIYFKNKIYIFFFFKKKKMLLQILNSIHLDITFNNLLYLNYLNNLNLKKLNYFFFTWNNYVVKRLKVRHKISWLKLFRKKYFLIRINYGFNLRAIYFLINCFIKKKRRYKMYSLITIFSLSLDSLYYIGKSITTNLKFDKYTLRGYRFAKQKCIKKVGKVSRWMDFKVKLL